MRRTSSTSRAGANFLRFYAALWLWFWRDRRDFGRGRRLPLSSQLCGVAEAGALPRCAAAF